MRTFQQLKWACCTLCGLLFFPMLVSAQVTQQTATLTAGTDFFDGDSYFDSGGEFGDYGIDELSTLDLCAAPGETITVTFTAFDVEASTVSSCFDNLTVSGATAGNATYAGDGNDAGAGLTCADATDGGGAPTLGPFTSAVGGCISFAFDSDTSVTQSGWEGTINTNAGGGPAEIPQQNATLTACTDFFDGDIYTDSGGSGGSYGIDELSTLDLCAVAGETVTVTFTAFDVEASTVSSCFDNLTVSGATAGNGTYAGDGNDAGAGLTCTDATDGGGAPTLGPFTSAVGGCLSFTFDSDGSINQSGWEGTISTSNGCGVSPCGAGESLVELELITDSFGSETSWELRDVSNDLIVASVPDNTYGNSTTFSEDFCLLDGCYEFTMFDSFGDGMGGYSLTGPDGNIFTSPPSTFSFAETTMFTTGAGICGPPNDLCADAIPLTLDVPETVNNVGATASVGEPVPPVGTELSTCNSQDGWCIGDLAIQNSVWYSFTPAETNCYDITGMSSDLQMAVYEGTCGGLTLLAANDDSNPGGGTFDPQVQGIELQGGTTYLIQLDGYLGAATSTDEIVVTLDPCYFCQDSDAGYTLNLLTDDFGGETGFSLSTDGGLRVVGIEAEPGDLASNTAYEIPLCGDSGCYEFTITDSFGDGICCGFGEGSWNITGPTGFVLVESPSGGAFGSSETVEFCTCDLDTEKPDFVNGCPAGFEVITDQETCLGLVEQVAPEAVDPCLASVSHRVREVDPNTLTPIGPSLTPWTEGDLSIELLAGTYRVRWRAEDLAGNRRHCNQYIVVSEVLPCPWRQYADGVGCEDGSSAWYDFPTETFWLSSEQCHNPFTDDDDSYAFVQHEMCGDGSITAQVTSLGGTNNGWAGVMMRPIGNDPVAQMISLATNLSANHRKNVREEYGGNISSQQNAAFNRHWLRIVRVGNSFRGYASSNGTSWFLKFSHTVPMESCIEVGLMLTSYVSSGDQIASFNNVVVEEAGGAFTPDNGGNALQVDNTDRTFMAYPSPTTGLTTVAMNGYMDQEGTLEVVNTFGQVLITRQLGIIEDAKEDLDLSSLPGGVYTIRLLLETGDAEMVQIIKQ